MLRVFIIAVLLTGSFVRAQNPEERDPWYDSHIGDWVIVEQATTRDGMVEESRLKHVRTDRLDLGVAISTFEEVDNLFSDDEKELTMHVPGKLPEADPMFKKVGEQQDALEIDGRDVECTMTEYRFDRPAMRQEITVKIWRSPEFQIPYRELSSAGPDLAVMPDVLRLDYDVRTGDATQRATIRVVSTEAQLTIDGEPVQCFYEEGSAKVVQGPREVEGKIKRWLSPKIPGGQAKYESLVIINGKEVRITEQVVNYGRGDDLQADDNEVGENQAVALEATPSSEEDSDSMLMLEISPEPLPQPQPTVEPTQYTLVAEGKVSLIIRSVETDEDLADSPRNLEEGEVVTFTSKAPVMIAASKIENLAVKVGGKTFRADGLSGVYKWYFNQSGPYTPE